GLRHPVAEHVARELPSAFTREFIAEVFNSDPKAEPVRSAFDRLTQRLQLSLLLGAAASDEQQHRCQEGLIAELSRLHTLDQEERAEQSLGPLQDLLRQSHATLEELRELAKSF